MEFSDLIRRVRRGDPSAAEELVREYEPEIRREVRLRLTDPSLRQTVDSMDICQSVWCNFFVRISLGQFDLVRPEQFVRLLITIARNKVIDRHRREQARGGRKVQLPSNAQSGSEPADDASGPSTIVAGRELVDQVRARMSDDEGEIANRRQDGQSWEEVAVAMGCTADAARKRLSRAVGRIFDELGLMED